MYFSLRTSKLVLLGWVGAPELAPGGMAEEALPSCGGPAWP